MGLRGDGGGLWKAKFLMSTGPRSRRQGCGGPRRRDTKWWGGRGQEGHTWTRAFTGVSSERQSRAGGLWARWVVPRRQVPVLGWQGHRNLAPWSAGQIEAMGPRTSQSACHPYAPARPFAIPRTWPALGGAPSSHKGSLRCQNIPTYRKLKLYTI